MNNKNKLRLKTIFVSASLALLLSACSDDEPKQQAAKAHNPWDHSHDAVVTDVQKHVFEHDFAEQCVEREVRNSVIRPMIENVMLNLVCVLQKE